MDILKELDSKDKELEICYGIIQLQMEKIKELSEKVSHLEKLLQHRAQILEFNKE